MKAVKLSLLLLCVIFIACACSLNADTPQTEENSDILKELILIYPTATPDIQATKTTVMNSSEFIIFEPSGEGFSTDASGVIVDGVAIPDEQMYKSEWHDRITAVMIVYENAKFLAGNCTNDCVSAIENFEKAKQDVIDLQYEIYESGE